MFKHDDRSGNCFGRQGRCWLDLIGVELSNFVGFKVSRALLEFVHLSCRNQEGNDCYNRVEVYSWKLSGRQMDWKVAIYGKDYVLIVFTRRSKQACNFQS